MLTPDPTGAPTAHRTPARLAGALIAGKYRLRRRIGHGGMGAVYKAENVAIGRTVAVKVLHGHLADDAVTVQRFQREARAAASVGHDNIIDILDMGIEPSGAPFIVMEYVPGASLARHVKDHGRFAPRRAVHVAGQILAGLAAAHDAGVIHRDLKPENVLLSTRRGDPDFVTIFDFGIAALVDAALDQTGPHDLTPHGRAMGTPAYSSPEQITGERIRDARVDLYAVGVLLFEMLTGAVPFSDPSFPDLCLAIATREPPSFAERGLAAPEGLEAAVRRALAKSPAHRYQSAREMAAALAPFGAAPIPAREERGLDSLTMELREIRARERLAGAPRDGHDETTESDEDARRTGAAVVRGDANRALLEFIAEVLGEARYRERLARDPVLARAARAPAERDAWVPGGLLSVLEQIAHEEGDGNRELVAQAGRHLARRAFSARDRDLLLRTLTPELFFALLPDLWRRYFALGEARVSNVSRGFGRLEIEGFHGAALAVPVAITGYLTEALRMSGARDVDVTLVSAVALGDAVDVFEATWAS